MGLGQKQSKEVHLKKLNDCRRNESAYHGWEPTHAQQLHLPIKSIKPAWCLEMNDDRVSNHNNQSDGANYMDRAVMDQ